MMRDRMTGAIILGLAIAIAWGVLTFSQAQAGGWIASMIGPARMQADAPLVETLFTLIVFVPLIVVATAGAAFDRRNAFAAGRRPAVLLALGSVIGFAGLSAAMLYARLAGALTPGAAAAAAPGVIAWGLAVIAVQTVAEEVYFRGWLQAALVARWGAVAGVIGGAIAFALLHVAGGARAPVSLLNLFLGGLMFGAFALWGRGIAAAVGVHLAWNASEQLLYGLDPNPGVGGFGAIADHDLAGAAIWGGSADGLNGSVGMTFVLLAILVPLLLVVRRGRAKAMT